MKKLLMTLMLGMFGLAFTGCDNTPMEQRTDELEERGDRVEEVYDEDGRMEQQADEIEERTDELEQTYD